MAQKFVNNLLVTTTANITAAQTTISVTSTAKFPSMQIGDWFYLTITDKREGGELRWEIVRVTSWSGTTLTCVRGQDGTTGQVWNSGSELTLRVVAADMYDYEELKDSKGQINGLAPLDPAGKVAAAYLYDVVNGSTQAALDTKVSTVISSVNAAHVLRKNNWIWNFDGTVTGAIQFKITGLYTRTMSGGMKVLVTQNNTADGNYPDYEFYVGGNWRNSGTTWHNTEARVDTDANEVNNVKFAHNGTDVFILIGDTNKVWNFPRIVVKDLITNTVAAGYTPDLEVTVVTALPATVQSTIVVKGLGRITDFTSALTAALV